ncbi:hypothetical protein [Hafnia paralvei]|uniref:hypothetical protein n=1 Tax=Hafnia paralvei TaxID=546367 RepID=UPI003C2E783A
MLVSNMVLGGVSAHLAQPEFNRQPELDLLQLPVQHAQKAKAAVKVKIWKGYGAEVVDKNGWVTIDGSPAAIEETNDKATVYSAAPFMVIIYKTGKVALMKERQFVGYLSHS